METIRGNAVVSLTPEEVHRIVLSCVNNTKNQSVEHINVFLEYINHVVVSNEANYFGPNGILELVYDALNVASDEARILRYEFPNALFERPAAGIKLKAEELVPVTGVFKCSKLARLIHLQVDSDNKKQIDNLLYRSFAHQLGLLVPSIILCLFECFTQSYKRVVGLQRTTLEASITKYTTNDPPILEAEVKYMDDLVTSGVFIDCLKMSTGIGILHEHALSTLTQCSVKGCRIIIPDKFGALRTPNNSSNFAFSHTNAQLASTQAIPGTSSTATTLTNAATQLGIQIMTYPTSLLKDNTGSLSERTSIGLYYQLHAKTWAQFDLKAELSFKDPVTGQLITLTYMQLYDAAVSDGANLTGFLSNPSYILTSSNNTLQDGTVTYDATIVLPIGTRTNLSATPLDDMSRICESVGIDSTTTEEMINIMRRRLVTPGDNTIESIMYKWMSELLISLCEARFDRLPLTVVEPHGFGSDVYVTAETIKNAYNRSEHRTDVRQYVNGFMEICFPTQSDNSDEVPTTMYPDETGALNTTPETAASDVRDAVEKLVKDYDAAGVGGKKVLPIDFLVVIPHIPVISHNAVITTKGHLGALLHGGVTVLSGTDTDYSRISQSINCRVCPTLNDDNAQRIIPQALCQLDPSVDFKFEKYADQIEATTSSYKAGRYFVIARPSCIDNIRTKPIDLKGSNISYNNTADVGVIALKPSPQRTYTDTNVIGEILYISYTAEIEPPPDHLYLCEKELDPFSTAALYDNLRHNLAKYLGGETATATAAGVKNIIKAYGLMIGSLRSQKTFLTKRTTNDNTGCVSLTKTVCHPADCEARHTELAQNRVFQVNGIPFSKLDIHTRNLDSLAREFDPNKTPMHQGSTFFRV